MKDFGKIIAHRGVHDNITIPENSIPAFLKAIRLDYAIELDVQLTSDNVLVVFHDDNLSRMTGVDAFLQKCSYDDIKSFSLLNTKYGIPTFQEVLSLVSDKVLLDIEIKPTKKIREVCSILMKQLEGYHNYVVKSFDPRIVRYMKKHYPSVKVGYLIHDHYDTLFYSLILPSSWILFYCKPDFLAISKKLLNTPKYHSLYQKYPILVWTIKKKDEMNSSSFHYICNNLPFH